MKYKIIASLSFTCLLPFIVKAQPGTIKVLDVVGKFYKIYKSHRNGGVWPRFEKREGNWYVKTVTEVKNWETLMTDPVLFYDGKKKSFIELELEKKESADQEYLDYTNDPSLYIFDVQPYYGYPGWYKDVIKKYNHKAKLTDWELYSLGMAYTTQALAPISHSDEALTTDFFQFPFGVNALSKKQLQQFSASADSAIAKFRQLSARNPVYPTKVGDARDKYAHEIVSKFHTLLTFSVDNSSKMILPRNIYKDSLLNANRSRLNACPPNAILYSSDDADFYPVLYLQQVEGVRKDVYLVNYYLLNLDKFIYRATQPQFESAGVVLSVDTSDYLNHTNEYFLIDDSSYSISAKELTAFLQSGNDENEVKVLAADHIDIPVRDNATAHIQLDKTGYMIRSQWVLLDILSNLKGRKMCFPKQFDSELKGVNPYLKLQDGLFVFDN
jgi:hypothetical protein